MNSDGDGTPSLPPHPMAGPPFHQRTGTTGVPPLRPTWGKRRLVASSAAPGGPRSVAAAWRVAILAAHWDTGVSPVAECLLPTTSNIDVPRKE